MPKKGEYVARDASSSSVQKRFLDVSKEPKSLYAKRVLELSENARFRKEYRDEQGKHHVIVKVPGRAGREVKINWVFNPQGEAMRKRALARIAGNVPRRFPREAVKRFPRLAVRRFPRLPRGGKKA